MAPSHRKSILLTAKVLLAALLLGWVFSQVHWRDYAVDKGGKTYAVLAERSAGPGRVAQLDVSSGLLWWRYARTAPADEFQMIPGTNQVRRPGFFTTIRNLKLPLLALAFAIYPGNLIIMAIRWRLLLRVADIHITLWESIRLSFLGAYFSIVVPGTVSGDLVKAYYVSKHTPAKAAALVSVFIDRAIGLTELTLMTTVMLLIVSLGHLAPTEALRTPAILVLVIVLGLIGAFAFLFAPSLRRALRLDRLYRRLPLAHHFDVAGQTLRQYRGNIPRLVEAMGITFAGQIVWIGSLLLIGKSLSLDTPWYNYFLYVPLIYTIAAIPLTPGGLGLVEKFFVVFFVSATVSPSEVVAMALLFRIAPMFWSLPGVVVAVTGARVPAAKAIQAELGLQNTPTDNDAAS